MGVTSLVCHLVLISLLVPVVSLCMLLPVWANPRDETEFFEKKIRPVLAEKCFLCHSSQAKSPLGGLRLDSLQNILKGGDSGPAIVPGNPEQSLLVKAILYTDLKLKMPPSGKLTDEEIADFVSWVKSWKNEDHNPEPTPQTQSGKKGVDLGEGRRFWAFQRPHEPAVPRVSQTNWVISPLDAFILSALEERGLKPAPPADRRTWLRRVTFDLIGLPPTSQEVESFLADRSPNAYEAVVERLLSSPHYGERWGRHWLDLVRFAETNGHEYDTDKLDCWRYRDYVIRAFNQDVSYSQFVKEHIAGDLLPKKRLSEDGTYWESPLATGFYWFGEVINSPTDSLKSRADQVDNQLDVLGKAFLGLTVACARCHDHKFDPIPTADYYSLAGIFHSTEISETVVDSPATMQQITLARQKIWERSQQIKSLLEPARSQLAGQLKDYLLAAAQLVSQAKPDSISFLDVLASQKGLNRTLLKAWVATLEQARHEPDHLFYPFVSLADRRPSTNPNSFEDAVVSLRTELEEWTAKLTATRPALKARGDVTFEDFEKLHFDGWAVTGQAFGDGPQRELPSHQKLLAYRGQGAANSMAGGSDTLVGSLTSGSFRMPKLYVHVRIAGSKGEGKPSENSQLRFTLVANGYKAEHIAPDGSGLFQWKTLRMTKELGRLCYFEIVDRSREGHIVISKIVFSDSAEPPSVTTAPSPKVLALLGQPQVTSLESLAAGYQKLFNQRPQDQPSSDPEQRSFREALNPTGKLEDLATLLPRVQKDRVAQLQQERAAMEGSVPESVFAMSSRDDSPHNVRIHIRGNHQNLGNEVPRRFLQILAGDGQPPISFGSGRLQLAEWVASPDNSLTARVMVNRIWKMHFGAGLVRTPDNFGQTGERPTHPQLLDFLTKRFVESGWSIKAMHRLMILSNTYRQSNRADPLAAQVDPENKLLHHMPVRRLEAEAIRDSILATAGTLDPSLFGPSQKPHISPFQEGRGKPESGPLDGNRRRSIYIQVRRNFLTPMFLAYDYPLPISTMGSRSGSTVPSQALLMMNNDFVALEAGEWAQRVSATEKDPLQCIRQMYLMAFGRPAESWEIEECLRFLRAQSAQYKNPDQTIQGDFPEEKAWADLGHVLFNSAEFIYIR
jgi:hypothetical protein